MISFFYLMQVYPEVQRKAQKEIDTLTGGQRLLGFDDYESGSLPYVSAIIKEILRWGPVLPLGVSARTLHIDDTDELSPQLRLML